MADRWVGPKTLQQQKIKQSFEAEKIGLVVPYTGPIAAIRSGRPQVGQQVAGFTDFGLKVDRVEIDEGDAETGTMTVYLATSEISNSEITFEPIGEPIYEVEWQELVKPIEQHPDCGILNPNRPEVSGKKRTWDDWADLNDTGETGDYVETGGWSLEVYQEKRAKGIDSFLTGAPVVRRTIYYFRNPGGVGANCFERESPPVAAGAPSTMQGTALEWIKGTDKLVKEGRLRTRTTEWMGAWEWDHDVYPT